MNAPEPKIHIIGVGSDGLAGMTSRARELLGNADLVLGAEQTLNLVPELKAERRRLGPDLQEAVRILEGGIEHKPHGGPEGGGGLQDWAAARNSSVIGSVD